MATFIRADGSTEYLQPSNGVHWSLEELQTLVGGYIELAGTRDGRYLVLDEEGKLDHKGPKPINRMATALYKYGDHDPIVGDVLLVDTKLELDGPEDVDEEDD